MYKILEKTQFSEKVFKFRIERLQSPSMRTLDSSSWFAPTRRAERVPFTLAGWNGDEAGSSSSSW